MFWLLVFGVVTTVVLVFNHGAHNDDDEFDRFWSEEWDKNEY